jgi:hypothetical protein
LRFAPATATAIGDVSIEIGAPAVPAVLYELDGVLPLETDPGGEVNGSILSSSCSVIVSMSFSDCNTFHGINAKNMLDHGRWL